VTDPSDVIIQTTNTTLSLQVHSMCGDAHAHYTGSTEKAYSSSVQ